MDLRCRRGNRSSPEVQRNLTVARFVFLRHKSGLRLRSGRRESLEQDLVPPPIAEVLFIYPSRLPARLRQQFAQENFFPASKSMLKSSPSGTGWLYCSLPMLDWRMVFPKTMWPLFSPSATFGRSVLPPRKVPASSGQRFVNMLMGRLVRWGRPSPLNTRSPVFTVVLRLKSGPTAQHEQFHFAIAAEALFNHWIPVKIHTFTRQAAEVLQKLVIPPHGSCQKALEPGPSCPDNIFKEKTQIPNP